MQNTFAHEPYTLTHRFFNSSSLSNSFFFLSFFKNVRSFLNGIIILLLYNLHMEFYENVERLLKTQEIPMLNYQDTQSTWCVIS